MVKTKLVTTAVLAACLLGSCSRSATIEWQRVPMDGHRVHAQSVTRDNLDQALGVFDQEGFYVAPSGVRYSLESPVAQSAKVLLAAQERLGPMKTVIGHSDAMLMNLRTDPDLPLGNLFADALRAYASRYFHKPMDFAITNFGGIRVPLPKGDITMEDVSSMFPFKNYLCWCKVKGEGLIKLFEQLSGTKAFQATSGATIRVKDHKLESALIGGKPIDPNKVYNVATIDFLLDGGDQIAIGALSEDVQLSHVLLKEVMLDFVQGCEARGEIISGKADGRVIME